MWGETCTIGNCLELADNVPAELIHPMVWDIIEDNIKDSIKFGYWKKIDLPKRYIKRRVDPLENTVISWKCKVLPVSSMESFQFHIGFQFDEWFRNEFHLFEGGRIWNMLLTFWRSRHSSFRFRSLSVRY